ncbi:lysozyme, partial [Bacteroides gallinaceum]|nr:lysozyme [Bacteroides gallinaceum]
LLLATLAYNIGAFKLLGLKGKYPKSTILKKLDSEDRNIQIDYVKYCYWRGKKIASIERRRYVEFLLLFDL